MGAAIICCGKGVFFGKGAEVRACPLFFAIMCLSVTRLFHFPHPSPSPSSSSSIAELRFKGCSGME